MLVFIIDSDENFVIVWRYILHKEGFKVAVASCVAEAKVFLQINRPDVIICDMELDDVNIEDFCQYIRSFSDLRRIPLIIIGALGDDKKRKMCLKGGAQYYLAKPFTRTVLLEILDQVVAQHRVSNKDEQE
ncbi:MAG: response regulator [Actinobacteria bacterium]|nr:response regulator [Actinomycetota bacterium]